MKILVIIPSLRGVSKETLDSIQQQTITVMKIIVSNKKYSSRLSVGERVAKACNYTLSRVDLTQYDYILRTDDDAYLPNKFLEKNLELNADVVGSSGYGQLIKVKPFLFYFKGKFPVVGAEDSYIFHMFNHLGLKASKYNIRPRKLHKKKHNKKYWMRVGEERYKIGYLPHIVLFTFRDSISGYKVGYKVIYIVLGYFTSFTKRMRKYPFNKTTQKLQILRTKDFQE